MEHTQKLSDKLLLVLKGLAMGAANKVPGISGGVVAFVVGFYEEFIYSLQKVNVKSFKLLISGRFKVFWEYINGRFLGLLFLGMIISYFSISKLLDFLLIKYELFVWSAFFGMIIGSIYYISKDFGEWTKKYLGFVLLGIIAGVSISFLEPAHENDNLWFVFFCGMVGISGMTLPGLSGSFILILLGNYVLLMVDAVNALFNTIAEIASWDFSFLKDSARIRLLQVLAVFSLGSLVGLVTLSHLLSYVLKHYKKVTFAIIIGFITGSLGVVWPWKKKEIRTDALGNPILDTNGDPILDDYHRYWPSLANEETWCAIIFIFVGIAIVIGLEIYGKKRKERKKWRNTAS